MGCSHVSSNNQIAPQDGTKNRANTALFGMKYIARDIILPHDSVKTHREIIGGDIYSR